MIFAVFILAKNNIGQFAMTTRDNGSIGLPGGKIDKGENVLEAALREAKEEGWNLKLEDNKPFHVQEIEGKKCAWIKGSIIGKYIYFKEINRITPFYGTLGDVFTSGFGNEVALHIYLRQNFLKNKKFSV